MMAIPLSTLLTVSLLTKACERGEGGVYCEGWRGAQSAEWRLILESHLLHKWRGAEVVGGTQVLSKAGLQAEFGSVTSFSQADICLQTLLCTSQTPLTLHHSHALQTHAGSHTQTEAYIVSAIPSLHQNTSGFGPAKSNQGPETLLKCPSLGIGPKRFGYIPMQQDGSAS